MGKLFVEVVEEFFNVKVVEELFSVEVVEEVFVFTAIRLLRGSGMCGAAFYSAGRGGAGQR